MDEKLDERELLTKADPKENKGGTAESTIRSVKGVVVVCLVAFLSSLSAVCVQGLGRRFPDYELNAIRSVSGWITITGVSLLFKIYPVVKRKEIVWLAIYACLGFISTTTYFMAVTFVSMATEESVYHTTQIFTGFVLFWVILKEKPTLEKAVAVVLCAVGVFLVVQPDFIFPTKFHVSMSYVPIQNGTMEESGTSNDRSQINTYLGCGLAFLTGIGMVCRLTAVKWNPQFFGEVRNQPIVVFWVSLTGAVLSTVITIIFEKPVLPANLKDYLLVTGHAISYIMLYPGCLYAGSILDGNTFNILYTSCTVYMVIAQYTILKNIYPGHRNWIEILGVGLIILGCIVSPLVKLIKTKRTDCDAI